MVLYNIIWRDWRKFNQDHPAFVLFFYCPGDIINYNYCINIISQIYSTKTPDFARMDWYDARTVSTIFSIRDFSQVSIVVNRKIIWKSRYPTMQQIKEGFETVKTREREKLVKQTFAI